jgi:hypothetical protein
MENGMLSSKKQKERFELLLKFCKSSFLRKKESSPLSGIDLKSIPEFRTPAYAGMIKLRYSPKLSKGGRRYSAIVKPAVTVPDRAS